MTVEVSNLEDVTGNLGPKDWEDQSGKKWRSGVKNRQLKEANTVLAK